MKLKTQLHVLTGVCFGLGTFTYMAAGAFAVAPYALILWLCYLLAHTKL